MSDLPSTITATPESAPTLTRGLTHPLDLTKEGLMPDPTDERWLPIAGYEGIYEVSDQGRVRSLPRKRVSFGKLREPRILQSNPSQAGYPRVNIFRDGKPTMRYVHHLVLEAFIGPCPPGQESCHNNGDPADNRLENLRYDSHTENMRDTVRHGTNQNSIKATCPRGHIYDRFYDGGPGRSHRWCSTCDRERRR